MVPLFPGPPSIRYEIMPDSPAVQDYYPESFAHCFGCGRLNAHGHQIKTRLDGDEAVALFSEAARERGVTIDAQFQEGIPEANLDAEGIQRCLANLVSNAIDACLVSDAGGDRVIVRTRDRDGSLEYEVEDNGCGMDYEIKRKVFTSFFTTKGTEGTGLGLLVTKKIVQEHGGFVDIESKPGSGSTFRITLPRHRLPPPAEEDGDTTNGG